MERTTEKGLERLISSKDGIEVWAVVEPSPEYITKISSGNEQRIKEERKIELMAQIKALEEGILYSMINGDEVWVESKKEQREILKQEFFHQFDL